MSRRLILGVCLSMFGCAEVRDVQGPRTFEVSTAPAGVTVYYDRDIQSVFNRSCTGGCHEAGGSGVERSGLDLTSGVSYAELLDATRSLNGPHVVAGDPDNSLLVWKVEGVDASGRRVFGDIMPLDRPVLSGADVLRLRTWIAEGALQSVAPPSPPRILDVAALDSTTVEMAFDKALDPTTATQAGNYTVSGEDGFSASVVLAMLADGSTVRLTIDSGLPVGGTVSVSATGVRDLEGLEIVSPEIATFQYTPVVSFAAQIQPVFDLSCAFIGCHAADASFPPGAGLVLDPGAAHGQLVGVNSEQAAGRQRVVAGDPQASYLIAKLDGTSITGDRMPVGGPFLSASELRVFTVWIEQGAADN